VRPPAWTLDKILNGCALVVVLDGVQAPGGDHVQVAVQQQGRA